MAKPGRPKGYRTFAPEVAQAIVARLAQGEPLTRICSDEGMPDPRTVWNWQEADEGFASEIARARLLGYDRIAEDALEIADDGRNDWMERHGKGDLGWVENGEHVQRSKLRIWTRLELLKRWDPKRYGESQKIEHSGSVTIAASAADELL